MTNNVEIWDCGSLGFSNGNKMSILFPATALVLHATVCAYNFTFLAIV